MTDSYRNDGISLSERDLYLRLVDELKICRELTRGIAHQRKDTRWLKVSGLFDQIAENAKALYTKKTGLMLVNH